MGWNYYDFSFTLKTSSGYAVSSLVSRHPENDSDRIEKHSLTVKVTDGSSDMSTRRMR